MQRCLSLQSLTGKICSEQEQIAFDKKIAAIYDAFVRYAEEQKSKVELN